MADYELIIGLEVHCQLQTNSKLFTGCINAFNPDQPNSQTDPYVIGLPGTLPVMNKTAFRLSVKTALALDCTIARFTKWDRKQYFYPDLPKGYQISQFDLPFSQNGKLVVESDVLDGPREVRINRVHLEEDAGKNVHDESGAHGNSLVDLNRSGTPLMEIVSEPDMRSAVEAKNYLSELRLLLLYLGVSDCNMQEGSLRCDANVNLRIKGDNGEIIPTPIVEIKNMNSFRHLEGAIRHEEKRQLKEFQKTGQRMGDVPKQTRGWDAEKEVTFAQRSKEEAADYRYFPDPDLVPVTVTESFIEEVRGELCERPADRRTRFVNDYQLSDYDANVIVDQGREFADYFETAVTQGGDPKQAANVLTQDLMRYLKDHDLEISKLPLSAEVLADVLVRLKEGKIASKGMRELVSNLLEAEQSPTSEDVDRLVQELGLELVTDTAALDEAIDAVLSRNEAIVADVRGGKQQAAGPLIGQVMKQLKGADPKTVRARILERITQG